MTRSYVVGGEKEQCYQLPVVHPDQLTAYNIEGVLPLLVGLLGQRIQEIQVIQLEHKRKQTMIC